MKTILFFRHGRRIGALVWALVLGGTSLASNAGDVIWSIGEPNDLSIEFALGSRDQVTFSVGSNISSRDFPGRQEGSLGFDGKTAEKPYTIVFDLDNEPQGNYALVLDLIYRTGAPRQIKIRVNGRVGIFPVCPVPKKSSDGEEGNAMLLSKQHLVVPIRAAWLKAKENRITIMPLGIGGLTYDAVRFESLKPEASESGAGAVRVEPTIYFRKSAGKLAEVCNVIVPFQNSFEKGSVKVCLRGQTFTKSFSSDGYNFGVLTVPIDLPATACSDEANVEVRLDDQSLQATHALKSAKQWKVFICPKVHNDVGYTDLQPHVNELDNRNTDTVLDILSKYPFYKFNFETSWLVENYLDCRTQKYREQFYAYAGQRRAAINALYLNLMTGICSGEELYRAMYYTHRLHRQHGSNFDFACITDAPSHSWFLPTLFSDVGIKAFSNGSNQTRAPILHYSDLNEDSPFYWEGMNGERILMWYARSYVQLKRLTGPDWGGATSNYEYLHSSVPQFLCRYVRDEYAPDAVMIYGAYVDNAAIPRAADAPVIEQWNKEYEFPKLIVASDSDYFNYIEKNFSGELPIHRGDCGAYWEDGVASSAQATTLNRRTQQILPAAEIAATLASIFEPRNRYPAEDFRSAWKNVMFYDEHTWGAHNSVGQPDRQFVTRQWEIKEGYATRANLDGRTLLARANNRLCQEIAVNGSSIIALNWQNRARTEPLEVEIDSSQELVDLANNKPVPMDVLLEKDGYRKVRFVAKEVPSLGYRSYALRSLNPAAQEANRRLSGDTIENEFYRLTVDTQNGGVKRLFDKIEKRELLDETAPYRLNEYLYVSGGENSLILNHNFGSAPATLTIHEPEKAEIIEHLQTPLGQRIAVVTPT